MSDRTRSGKLITFEGIDFSGKSTQAHSLQERLKKLNIDSMLLRDPGVSRVSERIRDILLDKTYKEMSPVTELLLYEAARAQMVDEFIIPALKKGTFVLCDRFYDSTTAYQGYGRQLSMELVLRANTIGSCQVVPDLTFFIDVDPEAAEKRKNELGRQSDRLESEDQDFRYRVYSGFVTIAKENSDRIVSIDGKKMVNDIEIDIWKVFTDRFKSRLKTSLI